MTREIEIKVKLRWRDISPTSKNTEAHDLLCGEMEAGLVASFAKSGVWQGYDGLNDQVAKDLPTREAAMEAVEAAVIKALGGE